MTKTMRTRRGNRQAIRILAIGRRTGSTWEVRRPGHG